MADTAKRILLSFDAEEFDIPREFGHDIDERRQIEIGAEGFTRVLDVLDRLKVRATFFTTANLAVQRPSLVKRAAEAGHEIASHGYWHAKFSDDDLLASRLALQELSGVKVTGFRRPRMAPTDPVLIAKAGYRYNSSENPIWLPGRYNKFFASRRWSLLKACETEIVQIPAAATPLIRWPLFWLSFKNAPLWWTKQMTAWCLGADGYAALYFHPWELCELNRQGGFGLPKYVRRMDGDALTARLVDYLTWLKPRGEFTTYGQFAESCRQNR